MANETPYIETELLLAVMNDDEDRAVSLLGEMLPGERQELARQCDQTAKLLRGWGRQQRKT